MIGNPRLSGAKAINIFRLPSAGANGQTVTIGTDVFELATRDDLAVTAGRIAVDLTGGATRKAKARLTISSTGPLDTETVTINGKVYTFQDTLTDVDGHVLIGATPEDTIDNLIAAINGAPGAGTTYATSTVTNTICTAAKSGTDKVILTAIIAGTVGNAYTLAEAATNFAKDSTTFGTEQAGVDPIADEVSDALVTAINALPGRVYQAREISDTEFMIVGKNAGPLTLACTETLTGTNNAWAASAMYGGVKASHRKLAVLTRVPTTVEVALGNMHFELTFTPSIVLARVRVTATPGVNKAWDGAVTIDHSHVVLDNAGSTDWAATDTLEVIFIE